MAHTSVYGIYASRQDAEMAIDSMRASGFLAEDISVLFPDNEGTKDIGHKKKKHTKAPERATAGAAIAGIAGGALGWLAGLGVLAIPGLGPFIAAGPILAALAGVVRKRRWRTRRRPRRNGYSRIRSQTVRRANPEGGILLSVHCGDTLMVNRAKEMLRHAGAQDIAAGQEGQVPAGNENHESTNHGRLNIRSIGRL